MNDDTGKIPRLTLRSALAGGLALCGAGFAIQALADGYGQDGQDNKTATAAAPTASTPAKRVTEGKCGEGKCGAAKAKPATGKPDSTADTPPGPAAQAADAHADPATPKKH